MFMGVFALQYKLTIKDIQNKLYSIRHRQLNRPVYYTVVILSEELFCSNYQYVAINY